MTYSETDKQWNFVVVMGNGVINMLQNMDAPTARKAYQELMPQTRFVYINHPNPENITINTSTDRPRELYIIGPEGVDLDPWRGVDLKVVDCSDLVAKVDEWFERTHPELRHKPWWKFW
ncbi:MAG: hypothetical protein ABW128_15450 [Rhizorhabdus sp.]